MFTTQFELVLVGVSFLIGTFWGPVIWGWIKSKFVSEVVAVETKVGILPTGPSGTAAPTVTTPVGATGAH